jgi:glutamyl-tRNA synthetase
VTKVRFAPSPTGFLQVGNARIALVNWLFARQQGGELLLRLDDTDTARSDDRFVQAIAEDLTWLGVTWDDRLRQSDRQARYDAALERLTAAGRLYPCYETEAELEAKRQRQQAYGKPPVYDRAALELSEAERARLEAEGRRPHWRFKLEPGTVAWDDLVRGTQSVQAGSISDPVLVREDGRPLYTLTSMVDDLETGITHVIRGEDHVTNTAAQIQLAHALEGTPPAFAHLPLLLDTDGRKLSKRSGGLALHELRERRGIEAIALASYLSTLGSSDAIAEYHSLNALLADFDLTRFSRAAPKFDDDQLLRLNARILHATEFDQVKARLAALGLHDVDARFWEAVRANITCLPDVALWYRICHDRVTPWIEDPAFAATAARLLPEEPWGEATWSDWTATVKAETGRKGAKLFKPLRKALTGLDHGPELQVLLPRIGRARATRRLMGETA